MNVATGEYVFYDSLRAVSPEELRDLFRYTRWGKSRSLEQIERMLAGTSLCFSARSGGKLVAFSRVLTDFVFRASLWDILVHPEHQGQGIGSKLLEYALSHPAIRGIPVVVTFASEMVPFLTKLGFREAEGLLLLQRRPIEYS